MLSSNNNNNNNVDNKVNRSPSSSTTTKFKQIIITGGSSGIGLAIGKEAARRYDVNKIILIARDIDKLETAKTAIMAGKPKQLHCTRPYIKQRPMCWPPSTEHHRNPLSMQASCI